MVCCTYVAEVVQKKALLPIMDVCDGGTIRSNAKIGGQGSPEIPLLPQPLSAKEGNQARDAVDNVSP